MQHLVRPLAVRCFLLHQSAMAMHNIIDDFALLIDWEDRYRYLIELGRALPPFPEEKRLDSYKVRGCASQVWLVSTVDHAAGKPVLHFQGDSDAHIVRGLIALVLALYSGQTADAILAIDAMAVLKELDLQEHLSPQRSNGLHAMVSRIRHDAQLALAAS
jgi:cysteine desulfuration protein SufE